MKISCIVLLAVGFFEFSCAGDTNTTSVAIADHRQKYMALEKEYSANYSTIITNEPQRYALVQAQLRERAALVKLGYLVEVDIQFSGQWSDDLAKAMCRTAFQDRETTSWVLPHVKNGLRVITVVTRPDDIPLCRRIIAEYDVKTHK